MGDGEEFSDTSRAKVIRPVQFQEAPEQEEQTSRPAIRVQIKVASTPEKLGQKIITYMTTELRLTGAPIAITNVNPQFRFIIHAVQTGYPDEVVMAVVSTVVLDLSAIDHIELTEELAGKWNLSEDQITALRQLRAGADLHHMALEHGLKIMYSNGEERTIEPYESILSVKVWKSPAENLSRVIEELVTDFEDNVLERERT